jgi:hypothetical protein
VRNTITVIICKSDKDLHTNPVSYFPNTLLSFLGKIFESLLTKRITCWAKNNSVIAQGHSGGRENQVTENTNLFPSSWIRQKWRENRLVSALFVDAKSAAFCH